MSTVCLCTFLLIQHRLCFSLLTSNAAKLLELTAAALHLYSPAVRLTLNRWTEAVWENGPEPYYKLGCTAMTDCPINSKVCSRNTQHVSGIPPLWRRSPYRESPCQVVSDGVYRQAHSFFSAWNTQLGFFSAFGSLERRWCVCERERKKDRVRV